MIEIRDVSDMMVRERQLLEHAESLRARSHIDALTNIHNRRYFDLALERGGTLPNARLVWQAHGALNPARDNAVLYPCSYSATTDDLSSTDSALAFACYALLGMQAALVVWVTMVAGHAPSIAMLAHLVIGSWMAAHVIYGMRCLHAYASMRAMERDLA